MKRIMITSESIPKKGEMRERLIKRLKEYGINLPKKATHITVAVFKTGKYSTSFGFSFCSNKDKFNKAEGHKLAKERALQEVILTEFDSRNFNVIDDSPFVRILKRRGVYEKVIYYVMKRNKMSRYQAIAEIGRVDILTVLFTFSETEEGIDYWWDMSNEIGKELNANG